MTYLVVYYEMPRGKQKTKFHEVLVRADGVNATGPTLGFYRHREHNTDELVAAFAEWHHFREVLHD